MENRKPFELRNILIYYNLFQVLFSSWLFYEVRFQLLFFINFIFQNHYPQDFRFIFKKNEAIPDKQNGFFSANRKIVYSITKGFSFAVLEKKNAPTYQELYQRYEIF